MRNTIPLGAVLALIGAAGTAHGAFLLTIDVTDPSAVEFRATGAHPLVDPDEVIMIDGFTLENFFAGVVNIGGGAGNFGGTLSPSGSSGFYNEMATFDYDADNGVLGPADDLAIFRLTGPERNDDQGWATTEPAFSGIGVANLAGLRSLVPEVGRTGTLWSGFLKTYPAHAENLGQWRVVPSPSAALAFPVLGCFAAWRRRRPA